ncbi:hypothetical protein [Streptomyces neyagawaensis]|uniref:hypothetical protein n=1 Tax=Streptomyces neyagawaensis TaxID=42238 RepID=UPI000AFC260C|nr:hypothetical protein [Streptomyces neyagawaensis]MCL6733280.1 hypothetical protein [Streptomyces neyagawaensis]MDE1685082.1 hypothetical protein [Streptomyces neyagawaensis]
MSHPSSMELAQYAYAAYGAATHYRTHDGRQMPEWEELGDRIQQAWVAAAAAVAQVVIEQPAESAVRSEQPTPQRPSIGRIVHYTLTEQDAAQINRLRQEYQSSARLTGTGFVGHVGNHAQEGDVYPAMIVRIFDPRSTTANLKVLLDGNDEFWATSRQLGDGPSFWAWPGRV